MRSTPTFALGLKFAKRIRLRCSVLCYLSCSTTVAARFHRGRGIELQLGSEKEEESAVCEAWLYSMPGKEYQLQSVLHVPVIQSDMVARALQRAGKKGT